jgi:hypothetical protein
LLFSVYLAMFAKNYCKKTAVWLINDIQKKWKSY